MVLVQRGGNGIREPVSLTLWSYLNGRSVHSTDLPSPATWPDHIHLGPRDTPQWFSCTARRNGDRRHEEQTDRGSQWVIIGRSGWTEGLGYPNGGRLRTRRSTWFPRVGYPRTGAEHAPRQKDASLPLDTGWGGAPHQVTRVSCAESPVDQCQCLLGTIYSVPVHGELCLELGHSPPLSVVRSVGEGGRVVGRRESGDTYEYRE